MIIITIIIIIIIIVIIIIITMIIITITIIIIIIIIIVIIIIVIIIIYLYLFIYIYNIRRIARLFPTVHYALNLRDAARNELDRNMGRRYDFRCRRKPKCSEKTCAGKYGSRTKFTYDSDLTGNRTRAALVKGTGNNRCANPPAQIIMIWGLYLLWYLWLPRSLFREMSLTADLNWDKSKVKYLYHQDFRCGTLL